jgi:biopolymer transport protein ExbD
MAFGGFNDNKNTAPMSEINVMLVLLVIFIITAPMFTHAIKLDLPSAQAAPSPEKPETVSLSINDQGTIFWNDAAVEQKDLDARLAAVAQKNPQPELQLRADKSTRYEVIAQVMAAAQNNGLTKMGFVTDPKEAAQSK